MNPTDRVNQFRLAALRGHCAEIRRLSPPILLQTQEDGCSLRFPPAVHLLNDSVRRHLAALFTDADCVSMETDGTGIVLSFRVRGAEDG